LPDAECFDRVAGRNVVRRTSGIGEESRAIAERTARCCCINFDT